MATNFNKDNHELKYYYTENGATLGPFTFSQLIEKISSDTLVYREGIEWTNAKDVEELKEFFETEVIAKSDITNVGVLLKKVHKKSTFKSLFFLILLIGVCVVGLIFFINPPPTSPPIKARIYANIQKRNQIIIGSFSLDEINNNFKTCLKNVFGDRVVKESVYRNRKEALEDMRNENLDILILTSKEIIDFKDFLDISEGMVWEGYEEDIFLGVPKNNQKHLANLIACINEE